MLPGSHCRARHAPTVQTRIYMFKTISLYSAEFPRVGPPPSATTNHLVSLHHASLRSDTLPRWETFSCRGGATTWTCSGQNGANRPTRRHQARQLQSSLGPRFRRARATETAEGEAKNIGVLEPSGTLDNEHADRQVCPARGNHVFWQPCVPYLHGHQLKLETLGF